MNWLRNGFWNRTRGCEFWFLPWLWRIISIPLEAGRGISAETCGLNDVFPPDDLWSRPHLPIYYIHTICYRCTLSYQNKLFLKRHTYQKLVPLDIMHRSAASVYRTVFWVCYVVVLCVIMCFYYSPDRVLFHREFHHHYYWNFYSDSFQSQMHV